MSNFSHLPIEIADGNFFCKILLQDFSDIGILQKFWAVIIPKMIFVLKYNLVIQLIYPDPNENR